MTFCVKNVCAFLLLHLFLRDLRVEIEKLWKFLLLFFFVLYFFFWFVEKKKSLLCQRIFIHIIVLLSVQLRLNWNWHTYCINLYDVCGYKGCGGFEINRMTYYQEKVTTKNQKLTNFPTFHFCLFERKKKSSWPWINIFYSKFNEQYHGKIGVIEINEK